MSEESIEQEVEFDRTSEHEGESIDTAGMMLRVKARLRRHEGWVNHMYRDTEGYVTVGVGFYLQRSDVIGYSWRSKITKRTVSLRDAHADWDKVSSMPYGPNITAAKFVKDTKVELSDTMIGIVLAKKLLKLRDDLKTAFLNSGIVFDELPESVQEAMLDLGYNVIGFQKTTTYPLMKAALKASDWNEAAAQSGRESPPTPAARNTEIRNLILQANLENMW